LNYPGNINPCLQYEIIRLRKVYFDAIHNGEVLEDVKKIYQQLKKLEKISSTTVTSLPRQILGKSA
jgi:hypothetical protein